MSSVWEKVKTRKIFRAATIYAAVAWGIIQIADVLLPVLGLDDWIMSSMVLVAFAGFPVALISGWMLDIKIARQLKQNPDLEAETESIAFRALEIVVIGAFGISAAYLYYNSTNAPVKASVQSSTELQHILSPQQAQKTIAVLPFANFSSTTNDEFFADGLSEELLNVLAKNNKLRVAARTSSFQYKNTNINIKKIARELGVQYVLEGSIRRSGELIRITAQLTKADENRHIFSKTWDRNTGNVFKVQDEIAQSVMYELKVSLLGEQEEIADTDIGTQSIDAFAEYSKGMTYLRNRGEQDFANAIEHFSEALEIDNKYAEAMAMLAETFLLQVSYNFVQFDEASKKAKPLIEKALALKPQLGAAHAVKGLYHWQEAGYARKQSPKDAMQKLEVAKDHFVKAINLNPSNAEAYMWYGSILQSQGEFKDGADLRRKAFEIDPQAAVVGFNRAQDLIGFGDYKGAMDVFNTVVRNNPNYPQAYHIAGNVSQQVGQLDQAYSMYKRIVDLNGNQNDWLAMSTNLLIPLGEFAQAQSNINLLNADKKHLNNKYRWLQASLWIASADFTSFAKWVESFEENTKDDTELYWRGLWAMKNKKWKYAIEDFSSILANMEYSEKGKSSEHAIRLNIFMAKSYAMLGNKLKSESFINEASSRLNHIRKQGIINNQLRYFDSSLAMLNNNKESSLALLNQSIQEGFVEFWWAEHDPIFDEIREQSDYQMIKQEFQIRMGAMRANIEGQYGQFAAVK